MSRVCVTGMKSPSHAWREAVRPAWAKAEAPVGRHGPDTVACLGMLASDFENAVLFLWCDMEAPGMGGGSRFPRTQSPRKSLFARALWGFQIKGGEVVYP